MGRDRDVMLHRLGECRSSGDVRLANTDTEESNHQTSDVPTDSWEISVIIVINGPINTGKSTTGRLLTARLPRTAHVEVDTLRAFLPSVPLNEAIPINLENTVAVTANLVRRGFNVVITYPLGDDDHAYLIEHLAGLGTTIHTFTLGPSLAIALSDRGERHLSAHERQRIRQQYADGRHAPPFGTRIDTSALTPQETAEAIIRHLGKEGQTLPDQLPR